jgi:hypothetical protein
MSTPSRAGSSMQHTIRLTLPRRMLQRSRDKTAQMVVQTSGTSGSAYRKKWVISTIFKKYLQCVLAARILTADFFVCILALKKIRVGFDMSDRTIPLLDQNIFTWISLRLIDCLVIYRVSIYVTRHLLFRILKFSYFFVNVPLYFICFRFSIMFLPFSKTVFQTYLSE